MNVGPEPWQFEWKGSDNNCIWSPFHCYRDKWRFEMVVRGQELFYLPDIEFKVPPLISTSLHKLAVETAPKWELRIKHRGIVSMTHHTTPKVTLIADGSKRAFGMTFHIGARPLYKHPEEVVADLQKTTLSIKQRHYTPRAATELDEYTSLRKFNDKRAAELAQLPPLKKPSTMPIEAEVLDFIKELRRREVAPLDIALAG